MLKEIYSYIKKKTSHVYQWIRSKVITSEDLFQQQQNTRASVGPVKEIHKIKIPFLSLTYAKSYKLAKISPENLTKLSNNIVNYVVSSKGETPDQSVAYPIYVIIMANITVQGLHGSQIIETTLRPGKWYMSVSQLNLELVNVLNELDEIYQFEDINEFQLKWVHVKTFKPII